MSSSRLLCDLQLRDAWSKILPYIANPSPLRGCGKVTLEIWAHVLYLEGELPCAIVQENEQRKEEPDEEHQEGESKRDDDRVFPLTLEKRSISWVSLLPSKKLCITRIPDIKSLSGCWTPKNVTVLHLTHLPHLTRIHQDYIHKNHSLVELVIEDLPQVTTIGSRVVCMCPNLKTCVLRRLPKLVELDHHFLEDCGGGKAGYYSNAAGDSNMDLIIMEDLPSLTTVSKCTLYCMAGSDRIRLADFPAVTAFEDFVGYRNQGVRHAVIEKMPELTSIGRSLFRSCSQLETVRLAELPKLRTIGNDLARDCLALHSLEVVDLFALEVLGGEGWLKLCPNLKHFSVRNLVKLREIHLAIEVATKGESLTLEQLPVLVTVDVALDWATITLTRVPSAVVKDLKGRLRTTFVSDTAVKPTLVVEE